MHREKILATSALPYASGPIHFGRIAGAYLPANIFDHMNICFDNISGTARPVHHAISRQFFTDIERAGYIEAHVSKQLYCEQDQLFLADRYVV